MLHARGISSLSLSGTLLTQTSYRCKLDTVSGASLYLNIKLQLYDAIYRLRFYSNSLIHILSLSNSYNNVASIQKNRGDKSHHVFVALHFDISIQVLLQRGVLA